MVEGLFLNINLSARPSGLLSFRVEDLDLPERRRSTGRVGKKKTWLQICARKINREH